MEELNQYIDVYILNEDINRLIPSNTIKRYKIQYNDYINSKRSLILSFEHIRLNDKLVKEIVKSTNVVYQQRKRLSLDNVFIIRTKLIDIKYKIFQQFKANVTMNIGNKKNNQLRRSYDENIANTIEFNMNDIYNDDNNSIIYDNESIQKALIKPEHFRRSRVKFLENERIRVSEGKGLSIDTNAYKYSPWEGTDFKYTLLISLQKKLLLKLIFNSLHHNACIKIMARQEGLNCVRLREKRYKQLCFSMIFLEYKLVKHMNIINEHKSLVYLQKKYAIPALKYLLRRRLYKLKQMKKNTIILKFYDRKLLNYGINILYWNIKYMRHIKQLSIWAITRLNHMSKCRSFLAFVLCYMKRNLSRISLSTKNINKTINSKDFFADDNDNIDIHNLRFNELRRECVKSLANQASLISTKVYLRNCDKNNNNNIDNDTKIKSYSGISGYWDSYTSNINESSKVDKDSRVMYLGGDKGIPINIDRMAIHDMNRTNDTPRTPLTSVKISNKYTNDYTSNISHSNKDTKSPMNNSYQSAFAISNKDPHMMGSQRSKNSNNSSVLDVNFNDTLRKAIASRPYIKTPVKQTENIDKNRRDLFERSHDDYKSNKSDGNVYSRDFESNNHYYEPILVQAKSNINISPSFLQDAMNVAISPKFSSNDVEFLSLDDETNAAYRLVRKCKYCLKKFRKNAKISIAYRKVRRAALKFRKSSSLYVWYSTYKKILKKYVLCDQIAMKKVKKRLLKTWYDAGITRFTKIIPIIKTHTNSSRKKSCFEMWHHVFRMKNISKNAYNFSKSNKMMRLFKTWKYNIKWNKKFNRIEKKFQNKVLRWIITCWKQKNEKTKLLRRVFRIHELAWLERDYSHHSQYRLLEKVIQAWSNWTKQEIQIRVDEVNYNKALLFRGISLISNAFFIWSDRTSLIRETRREKNLVEVKRASYWFRACFTSWKHLISQTLMWRAVSDSTHKRNTKKKVLKRWSRWASVRSRVFSDRFRRNHLLSWVFDKWCEARKEFVLFEKMIPKFKKNRLRLTFRAWCDIFKRTSQLNKGIQILSSLHRYLKFKNAIEKWPGRWQWKAAQQLLEKFKKKGRGRSRLVEVIEDRGDNKKLVSAIPPKRITSFLEPAKNKPTLLHRIAEMIMNSDRKNRKSVKETVEVLIAVLYAWSDVAIRERKLRGRSRMVIVNQDRLLRRRLFKVWISQCSRTAKRAMAWIRTGGHNFKQNTYNDGITYDDV